MITTNTGWQCPVCRVVYAPTVTSCSCAKQAPPTYPPIPTPNWPSPVRTPERTIPHPWESSTPAPIWMNARGLVVTPAPLISYRFNGNPNDK